MDDLETLAIRLYAQDGMLLAIYDDLVESWNADRENVRQRYREKASQLKYFEPAKLKGDSDSLPSDYCI